jgi:hypothetical protein
MYVLIRKKDSLKFYYKEYSIVISIRPLIERGENSTIFSFKM